MSKLLSIIILYYCFISNAVSEQVSADYLIQTNYVDMKVVETAVGGYAIAWMETITDEKNVFIDESLYLQLFDNNHTLLKSLSYSTIDTARLFTSNFSVSILGDEVVMAWAGRGVQVVKYNYVTDVSSPVVDLSVSGYDVNISINSQGLLAAVWSDVYIERDDLLAQTYGEYVNQIFLQLVDISDMTTIGDLKKVDEPRFSFDSDFRANYERPKVEFLGDNSFAVAWGKETFGRSSGGEKFYGDGIFYQLFSLQIGQYQKVKSNIIGLHDGVHAHTDVALKAYNNGFLISFTGSSYELLEDELYFAQISSDGSLLSDLNHVDESVATTTVDGSYWPHNIKIHPDDGRIFVVWSGYIRPYDEQMVSQSDYIKLYCSAYMINGDEVSCFSYPHNGNVGKTTQRVTLLMKSAGVDTRLGNSSSGGGGYSLFLLLFTLLLCRQPVQNNIKPQFR